MNLDDKNKNKMYEYIKNIRLIFKIFIYSIIVMIISTVVTLYVLPIVSNFLLNGKLGIKSNELVNFLEAYSSFLASLIAVIGFLVTIIIQHQEQIKNDAIKYKPILELRGQDLHVSYTYKDIVLFDETELKSEKEIYCRSLVKNNQPICKVIIQNVGRGEAKHTKLFSMITQNESESNILAFIEKDEKDCEEGDDKITLGEIVESEYFGFHFYLSEKIQQLRDVEKKKISIELDLDYTDLFDTKKYNFYLFVTFTLGPFSLSENECIINNKNIKIEIIPKIDKNSQCKWYEPK